MPTLFLVDILENFLTFMGLAFLTVHLHIGKDEMIWNWIVQCQSRQMLLSSIMFIDFPSLCLRKGLDARAISPQLLECV